LEKPEGKGKNKRGEKKLGISGVVVIEGGK